MRDGREPLVLVYFRELRLDLEKNTDREAILKLYTARGQAEDLLASTIRRGLVYYAERISQAFQLRERPASKLARLVAKLCPTEHPVAPDFVLDTLNAEVRGGPNDGYLWNVGGTISRHPFLAITADEAATLVRDIEETKAVDARRELDQLQGEFDTLTRAKALAESDRERKSLASQLTRLEERMGELEEHLIPLTRRRDELRAEIEELAGRIKLAERTFAEGHNLRKAQAIRDVLGTKGMILCHFDYGPRKTRPRPSRQPKSKPRKRCTFRGIEVVLSSSEDDPPPPTCSAGGGSGR